MFCGAAQSDGDPPASVNLRGTDVPPSAGTPVWHAIAEVGQAQKFLAEGRYYDCHSLKGVQPGDKVDFQRVLATKTTDGQFVLGRPYVPGAKVSLSFSVCGFLLRCAYMKGLGALRLAGSSKSGGTLQGQEEAGVQIQAQEALQEDARPSPGHDALPGRARCVRQPEAPR